MEPPHRADGELGGNRAPCVANGYFLGALDLRSLEFPKPQCLAPAYLVRVLFLFFPGVTFRTSSWSDGP